jgi:hypothetical protein
VRIIYGTVKSTEKEKLSVQYNIAPPDLQKLSHTTNTIFKLSTFQNWPQQKDILEHPLIKLGSRHPIWRTDPLEESIERLWKRRWEIAKTHNKILVIDPTIKIPR